MSQQTGRGWCPFAIHKPIPETYTQNAIEPRISILHSAGGSAELEGWWNNPQSKGLESHSFVDDETYIDPADGLEYAKLYQYVNIFVQADANREANDIAVSTETASTVNAAEPWSPPQVRTIVRWLVWCSTEAPAIKAQLCPSPRGSGIGWHVMFGAPGPWTPARGKVCPGPARIKQVPGIIAEVQQKLTNPTAKDWFAMATKQDLIDLLNDPKGPLAGIRTDLAEVKRQVAVSDPGKSKSSKGRTLRNIAASDLANGD